MHMMYALKSAIKLIRLDNFINLTLEKFTLTEALQNTQGGQMEV